MSAKETTIPALLTASATWTALATGGTWTWDTLGRLGLTPEVAASKGCYDASGKLKLTAVLTFGTSAEGNILTSEAMFFRVWYYHDNSYALIRQARRLAKNLLDRQQVDTDNEGSPFIRWIDDGQEFVADELGGCMAAMSRYRILFRRQ
jgi:hypothetical protein